ncbi:phosphoserine phosphatase [Teleopsis dalmanni]|uniref:phosphoserine phosphatase n=1 Tax=Teleopsis dalmanni TaxID=139649 RepID=UPI0018CF588A|nr:phosphoserine phosphatase [Teleopsis dalmanni]
MNCSAISVARTATNGVSFNGAFHTAPVTTLTSASKGVGGVGTNNLILSCNNTSNKTINMTGNQLNQATSRTSTTKATPTAETVTVPVLVPVPVNQYLPKQPELAAKIIQQSNIVCFDVDSTVITEEGIDELADFCGKGAEVARVTKEAMGGAMTFQDALMIRLNIIRPTQKQISDFIKIRPSILTRNVKRFIEQLKADGKQVYLISGGFDCLIEPVARELDIPITNLFANKLMFYHNGDYASFDTTQPTSKSGGKAEAISLIKKQNPDALITMIGDGATDLEAVPPANYFIGFGGNVVRAEVYKRAEYYITNFEQITSNS